MKQTHLGHRDTGITPGCDSNGPLQSKAGWQGTITSPGGQGRGCLNHWELDRGQHLRQVGGQEAEMSETQAQSFPGETIVCLIEPLALWNQTLKKYTCRQHRTPQRHNRSIRIPYALHYPSRRRASIHPRPLPHHAAHASAALLQQRQGQGSAADDWHSV